LNGSSNKLAFARRDYSRAKAKPIDPKRQAAKARRVAARLEKIGLDDGAVCLRCGSSDLSTFQFDHIAGHKYDPTLWSLCEKCHEEKTYVLYLDPPQIENPNNVFAVIARTILNLIGYFNMAIRFLQGLAVQLRIFAEFLLDLAGRGYDDELVFPT
jgi:hypothetical protein